jgi:hypothetical protein
MERTTAAHLREALQVRYAMPEWATFYEVACGTGSNGGRYADAVAMNMFPSRGLAVHGFEIKISRSDFLHELKQPEKSHAVQKYCDFWWLVTPKEIVKPGELPMTWGHLELRGSKLFNATNAPKLKAETIDRSFAAALIRRAGELDAGQRQAALQQLRERDEASFNERVESATRRLRSELVQVKESVRQFEEASGIAISSYSAARIGKGVLDLFTNYKTLPERLADLKRSADSINRDIDKALADFLAEGCATSVLSEGAES